MRRAKRCSAPCRAKRCSAPSDASCPAERSIVHSPLSIMNCPFLLRFSTQASLRAERSILHCPFSIVSSPSHTAKLQHGGGKIKHLTQTAPRGPRFPSCLPSQRAHCQPLSGKWAFALCPCPSRPSPCPLLLQCYGVTVPKWILRWG